ncbi:membrane protein [Croceicoccus naphthovorans]|uniref:Membrane protein n=1 Tax=Croceicoccus naphthovorans TaxID=1348774 RepID=A0A0G3XFJ3_9SPHN|nr:membrane protein [Croceicoccus naphthovorans]AKM09411.1 membrane protein [Croceicoccus naphthovorans]MBB3990345.1 putative membrane protein [Croceicoccus naphthovorans]
MDDIIIARAIHILSVLFWIGGVAFVTLVVMPSIRGSTAPDDRLAAFHRIEGRFAPQARVWVVLAGVSGFWMIHRAQMWDRFAYPQFWWMHAMAALWAIFFAMLFLVEPVFLHRRMQNSPDPGRDFRRMARLHRILLLIAVVTVLGATAGSHGLF